MISVPKTPGIAQSKEQPTPEFMLMAAAVQASFQREDVPKTEKSSDSPLGPVKDT